MQPDKKLSENAHQHPIFERIVFKLQHPDLDVINDEIYFANLQRPDFVFNKALKPHHPFYCTFFAELQLHALNSDHKARIAQYNEMLMNARPFRKFIIVMLTNLTKMVLIKSTRGENNIITHEESHEYGKIKFTILNFFLFFFYKKSFWNIFIIY